MLTSIVVASNLVWKTDYMDFRNFKEKVHIPTSNYHLVDNVLPKLSIATMSPQTTKIVNVSPNDENTLNKIKIFLKKGSGNLKIKN